MTEISSFLYSPALKQIGMMSQPETFSFGRLEIERQSLLSLRRKFHEAVQCSAEDVICGAGMSLGRFLLWNNVADALVLLLKTYSTPEHKSVRSGTKVGIRKLLAIITPFVESGRKFTLDASNHEDISYKLVDREKCLQLCGSKAQGLEDGVGGMLKNFQIAFLRYWEI